MDLFTYLLGKNGKNTHRDLFSYLLGKNAGGSGTYTTFSGTSLNISNTLRAKIKNVALEGNTSQETTTGKNLFNKNNANVINGYIQTGDTILSSNGSTNKLIWINIKSSTTYTISKKIFSDSNRFGIATSVEEPAIGISISNAIRENNSNYLTVTSGQNDNYLIVYVWTNNSTYTLEEALDTVQIEEGSTATEYEPYTGGQPSPSLEYPQPIKVVTGEQNVEISGTNMVDQSVLFSTLTYNPETGYYSGTPSSAINSTTTGIFKENTRYTVKCVAYTTSTASTKESIQFRFDYSDGTETHINLSNNSTATTKTLTSASGKTVTNFQITYARARDINIKDLMLYEGTNTTQPYVPYQKQTYPLSLGNIELAIINDYKDYIFKNEIGSPYYNAELDLNGWYKYSSIGKTTLNGTEPVGSGAGKWHKSTSTNLDKYIYDYLTTERIYLQNSKSLCNYYIVDIETNNNIGYFKPNISGGVVTQLIFNYATYNTTTIDDWIDWVTNHNLIIYQPLSTPTYTKITNTTLIQQLENINNNARSYKDTTIIECTSASTDNETIVFSGDIKVTSVNLGNSLNTSLLSNNLQEEPNLDDVNEIEETSLDDTDEIEETLSIENEIKDEVSE